MARFDVSGLDETIKEMVRLGEMTGKAADAMLMAGAQEVRKAWAQSAERHEHRDTGDMIAAIGYARTPKSVGDVRMIDIYPQGRDSKGVRNAEKAFILHYGTRTRRASRWVDDADEESGRTVTPAMIRVWDEYLQTGSVPSIAAPARRRNRRN